MRDWRLLAVAAAVPPVAACGAAAADEDDAVSAATAFHAALAAGDGRAACALLVPRAESELRSAGSPCSEAVLQKRVPTPEQPVEASVHGTMAQVRYAGETVFLTELEEGWRVVAAACSKQPAQPYDCRVSAG